MAGLGVTDPIQQKKTHGLKKVRMLSLKNRDWDNYARCFILCSGILHGC